MAGTAKSILKGKFDLTVVGGGIVGLATARQVLLKHPKLRVCLLEKENELATHQSKRNSGVVHAGIYYKKGSLKSRLCIRGARLIRDYCQERNLPYRECGKLIVANRAREQDTLHKLFQNAQANRIEGIELITNERIREIQPTCVSALEAIWSPKTAIVDWRQVALSYAKDFERLGGKILTNFRVCKFDSQGDGRAKTVLIENDMQVGEYIESRSLVNCGGLYSDLIARQTGNDEHPKVVPFKGKYFILSDKLASSVKTNIYPVPNPDLPFLGVHVTPRVDGSVLIGPTSLLTFGYERYDPDAPLRFLEMYHILYRSGLVKFIRKRGNIKAGLLELWRNYSKERVAYDVQAFLPSIESADLIQTDFCGIRAQAITRKGQMVDDFLFETGVWPQYDRVLHVRNCPSPAATSSLAIAERVLTLLEERFI